MRVSESISPLFKGGASVAFLASALPSPSALRASMILSVHWQAGAAYLDFFIPVTPPADASRVINPGLGLLPVADPSKATSSDDAPGRPYRMI